MYANLRQIKIHTFISIAGFLQDHSGREDLGEVVQKFAPTQKVFIKGKGHFGRKSGVKELPEVIKIMEEN